MKQIHVREFRKEDIEAVHRLIYDAVDISYTGVYPDEALLLYHNYHCQENILNDAEFGYCVVAEYGGEIVGTGTLLEEGIRRVYINPAYQNSGIGRKVYDALEQQAVKNNLPRLELAASLVAKEFWGKLGFVFEKEESIPAGNEELKFYMMSKTLSSNDPENR